MTSRSRFTYFIANMILTSSLLNAQFGPMPAGGMPMPAMPGGAPQGFGGAHGGPQAPGGMPMPSEQELEQILQMIEKAAQENPELIKEWERQGQREILKMSEADLAAFGQMVGIAPEVLREEAQKALADELGTAPKTQGIPAAHEQEFMPQQPQMPQKLVQPAAPKPTKGETQQTGTLIKGLITQLADLQAKAASVREVHELIRAWLQELRELMFYARVIDRHEYHEHLSLPKFKGLSAALSHLYAALRTQVPNIVLPDDLVEEPTPYDLLGIKKSAQDTTIDAAYEKLAAQHNPKKLEQRLKAEGLDEKAIKQHVKKATLSFEAVEDAYEQLHDPQLRAQIDREIQAHKGLKQQKLAHATQAIKEIRQALEEAIYGGELLLRLEQFLQDYAPQQLALKKNIEEAEKKRIEEQKKHASITPTSTYGYFEPEVRYKQPGYDDYGYSSNFSPYSDYGSYDRYPDYSYGSDPDYSKPSSGADSGTGAPKTGDDKKDKGADKDKDKADGDKGKDGKSDSGAKGPSFKDAQEAEKIDKRTIDVITKDIAKNFEDLIKKYEPETKAETKTPGAAGAAPAKKEDTAHKKTLLGFKDKLQPKRKPKPTPVTGTAPTPPTSTAAPATTPAVTPLTLPPEREFEIVQEDISSEFQKFSDDLNIAKLATDPDRLLGKIELLKTSEAQEKELKKLAEKLEKNKRVIPDMKKLVDKLESIIDEGGNPKNADAYAQLVNDLETTREGLEKIRIKYGKK